MSSLIPPTKLILAVSFLSLTAPLFWSGLSGPEKAIQAYYEVQPRAQKTEDPATIVSASKANTMGIGFVPREITDEQIANAIQPGVSHLVAPTRHISLMK